MSKWSTLKAAIANVIKTNGTQAITGSVLQNVLNNIVSSLGENYQFVGIATTLTNPGTPDGNVFYLAGEGIYTNFSNLVIDTGQLGILIWNGSWSKQTLEIGAGSGNMILEWNTDVATTRKQVLSKYRKSLLQISYKSADGDVINEQYIGTSTTDTEWSKDSNWERIPNQEQLTELSNNLLYLENANNLNLNFIDDWGWQKGNRDFTTGEFKEGPYFVSDIVDVEGEKFEFSTNEKADFVCCYSVNGGISFRNSAWVNNFQIQGFTHIFIILADANDHYTGLSNTNVYTTTQQKYFKNAMKEDLDNCIKNLSDKVSLFDGRIKGLEADAYGGNKDVSIPFPFNPCLFAQNGSDITSDVYPDAYATDYLDLTVYDRFVVNGACILSFPYGVFYGADRKIIKTISPGGQSVVRQYPELVLERSEYPDNARYVRFHSYSKVDGKPIEYSCIGNKIAEGYETRFARLENNFGNITSPSIYKVIN